MALLGFLLEMDGGDVAGSELMEKLGHSGRGEFFIIGLDR
jgi:hypothetical protein